MDSANNHPCQFPQALHNKTGVVQFDYFTAYGDERSFRISVNT